MRFAIDAHPAARDIKTGTEEYTSNLLRAMMELPLQNDEEVVLYTHKKLNTNFDQLPNGWQSKIVSWPLSRGWTQLPFAWELLKTKPNVLFIPAHVIPRMHPSKRSGVRIVKTIHDIGFKRMPHLYKNKDRNKLLSSTKHGIRTSNIILTPSQFTKDELMSVYNVAPERIVVTPLGVEQTLFDGITNQDIVRTQSEYGIGSTYFVTASRMEKKKNIETLIKAFELFKTHRGVGDPFKLVLIGKPGFGYEKIKAIVDASKFKNDIHLLGFLPRKDILILVKSAFAYVYPSWYEGLGISALEALLAKTPLIASNIPPLREAAGNAAIYANPDDPKAFAKAMKDLLNNPREKEERIEIGAELIKNKTWHKTAEKTWEVLRGLNSELSKELFSIDLD